MDNIESYKYTKDNVSDILKDDLKNHYLKRNNVGLVSVGEKINEYKKIDNALEDEESIKSNKKIKFKYKFATKLVGSLGVVALVLGYKYFPDNLKNNIVCNWIKDNYNKDYSKIEVIEKIEECSKSMYSKLESIVPEDLYNSVVDNYVNVVKPKLVNFEFSNLMEQKSIDNTVSVFNESDIEIDNEELTLAEETVTTSSEISLMDMDVEEILSKKINIALPVTGTVTSIYGAREEVFENVGYHTGVDIANVLNTPVASATDGVVVLAQSMDKYYGNNIEIEKDGVIFKYAHLNEIKVKEGDEIKQGDIIGLMGSTGASTGSHLHFEVKINGRSVDPELLIKIR